LNERKVSKKKPFFLFRTPFFYFVRISVRAPVNYFRSANKKNKKRWTSNWSETTSLFIKIQLSSL